MGLDVDAIREKISSSQDLRFDKRSKIVQRNIAKGRDIEKDKQKLMRAVGGGVFYEQAVTSNAYLNQTIGPNKTRRFEENKNPKNAVLKSILLFEFLGCNYR